MKSLFDYYYINNYNQNNSNNRLSQNNEYNRIREYSNYSSKYKIKNLRFENIIIFDFNKQTITFFIRRFKHIVEFKENNLILRIFFIYLKKDTLK